VQPQNIPSVIIHQGDKIKLLEGEKIAASDAGCVML